MHKILRHQRNLNKPTIDLTTLLVRTIDNKSQEFIKFKLHWKQFFMTSTKFNNMFNLMGAHV
jgi:hypothetical protein